MAREVSGRGVAVAEVASAKAGKALDELLKKQLSDAADEADSAAAHEGQVAAASEEAPAEGASVFAEGTATEVASSGTVASDAVAVGAAAAGSNGWGATPWLIGGAAVVGGVAIAASSDDGDGDTNVINNPGGPGVPGDNPDVNDAPSIKVGSFDYNANAVIPATKGAVLPIALTINDPENDPVTTTLSNETDFSLVNGNLVLDATAVGSYTTKVIAKDDEGATREVSVTVVVSDAPGTPGQGTSGDDFFQLTGSESVPDNLNGGGGNDLFKAAPGDLGNNDQLNGGDGNDTLDVVMFGGESAFPRITSIETFKVESLGDKANNLNLQNVDGLQTINVVDKGDNSGPLNINAVQDSSVLINLTGDETVTVSVLDSSSSTNSIKTGVNAFTGALVLGNAIESVSIAADGDSNFDLFDDGKALKTVTVTGSADLTLNTYASTEYNFSAATGDNTLTFNAPKGAAKVTMGSGNDVVDFGTYIEAVSDPADDSVDGGAGFDVVFADLNTGITVEPIVKNVEKVSLAFLDTGPAVDAEYDASSTSNAPVIEIRDSDAYVNVNDLEDGSDIDIVGDIDNGDQGATFDFRSGSKATTLVSFVTVSKEETDLLLTGDLEVNDVKDLTVRVGENGSSPDNVGDGKVLTGGEVEITGAIALDDDTTTDLTIGTTEEDDDDIDNDGDLLVDGAAFKITILDLAGIPNNFPLGSAITQSDALENLTVSGLNGNIYLGDGDVADPGDYALADATNLRSLTVVADNATVSLGHVGLSNGAGALIEAIIGLNGNEDQASNLDEVNITGANRGLFNLDDINAGDLLGDPNDALLNGLLGSQLPVSLTLNGALIEEFNVATAERSETKNIFVDGGVPFGFNQIEDTVARAIEDLRVDIAESGRLMWGDIYTNLVEVTITGDGRFDFFNNNSGGDGADLISIYDEDDGAVLDDSDNAAGPPDEEGVLPTYNEFFALYFVRDIDATGHSGPLELDFRTFVGTNLGINGNLLNGLDLALVNAVQEGVFDGQSEVDAVVRIGDQDLIDNGIRFDSYGVIGFLISQSGQQIPIDLDLDGASVTIIAGDGDHEYAPDTSDNELNEAVDLATTDLGIPLYGLNLLGTTYGIVTGFGNDSVTTGSGDSDIYTGVGADLISAGEGGDLLRGGFGQDTLDVGDDASEDHVQFVGQWLDGTEEESGETLDDNYDRVLNFDSGEDVVELWNYISDLDGDADPTNDVGLAAIPLPHFNISAPDANQILQDFIAGTSTPLGTFIVEFTGEYINGDLKDPSIGDDELLEAQLAADFFNDITTTEQFFAIVWDEGKDDAALFFIEASNPGPVVAEDVSLVAIFEDIPENGFSVGDFEAAYVA
jgi:hypothetical protein